MRRTRRWAQRSKRSWGDDRWSQFLAGLAALGFGLSGCQLERLEGTLLGERTRGGPTGGDASIPAEPPSFVCVPDQVELSSASLRRLEAKQYARSASLRWLGGPELALDLESGANEAWTILAVEKYADAAEQLASAKRAEIEALFDCSLQGEGRRDCALTLIQKLGPRIFRRPLGADESEWLIGVFDDLRQTETFESSVLGLVELMLQSPAAIYLAEYGIKTSTASDLARALSGYERATRLALFLWGTTPDDALLAAAAEGRLHNKEGVRAIAIAMLNDERSSGLFERFIRDWIGIDGTGLLPGLLEASKDASKFPEANVPLFEAMQTEITAFAKQLQGESDRSYERLWTGRQSYVNQELATLYGIDFDQANGAFQWLELPVEQRSGLLTRAGFLALYAHGDYQSPILRGSFMLENVFCMPPGEPPPNANDTPVTEGAADGVTGVLSVRDSTASKTSEAQCAGCHSRINPMGFIFEHYDALGRWQDEETHLDGVGQTQTTKVDARGGFPSTDISEPVYGGIQASEHLWTSSAVSHCFSERWYRVALGDSKRSESVCASYEGGQLLQATQDIRELILHLLTSDPFLFVNATDAQAIDVQTSTRSILNSGGAR